MSAASAYVTAVQTDVELGIAALLRASGGFRCIEERPGDPPSVVWSFTGRHATPFRNLQPFTNEQGEVDADEITVRGITFVRVDPAGQLTFERHIDWNEVVAQLGVSRGRGGARSRR